MDYENGGFYIGTWAADVGDGLEVDGYFGYGIETESGFSVGLGFTGYYTGEFDDTYEEINSISVTACESRIFGWRMGWVR